MKSASASHLERDIVGLPALVRAHWPVFLGFVLMAVPAVQLLAKQSWSHEEGAHGPLVIATAAWLLWRKLPDLQAIARPGNPWLVAAGFVLASCFYVFGEAFDSVTLGTAGFYGAGLAILCAYFGWRALVRNWFIFVYLLFAVPPPSLWMDIVTAPLKQFVSSAATALFQFSNIVVTHQGVTLTVDGRYQLLVEDACSGLNSIIGLTAIGLFYIYLMRGSRPAYALLMVCLMVPIAVVSNILRIAILIFLTSTAGDEVAQGFLHFTAGIFLFAVSLTLVFLIDGLLFRRRTGLSGVMA